MQGPALRAALSGPRLSTSREASQGLGGLVWLSVVAMSFAALDDLE